jgi:hypothetical protein
MEDKGQVELAITLFLLATLIKDLYQVDLPKPKTIRPAAPPCKRLHISYVFCTRDACETGKDARSFSNSDSYCDQAEHNHS